MEISSESEATNDAEPLVLKAATPRINNIFKSDDNLELRNVLEKIALQYFSNDLSRALATPTGCYDAGAALPCLEKLEFFLDITEFQRALHLRRKPETPAAAIFTETDMREIHSKWMQEGSWMNSKTAIAYNSLSQSRKKKRCQTEGLPAAEECLQCVLVPDHWEQAFVAGRHSASRLQCCTA